MMNSDDRADLIFEVAELMDKYESMNHSPEDVRDVVVGYARGRNND